MNFILLLGTQWLKVQGACHLRTIILVNTEMEIFGLCIDSIIKNKIKINSTEINLMMTRRIKTLHFSTSTNVFATGKAHGDGPTKISLKQNDTHGDNVHANISFFLKTALGKSKSWRIESQTCHWKISKHRFKLLCQSRWLWIQTLEVLFKTTQRIIKSILKWENLILKSQTYESKITKPKHKIKTDINLNKFQKQQIKKVKHKRGKTHMKQSLYKP